MSVVFISPHLDDAVFSCGTLIAALALIAPVQVLTVFEGGAVRRREDRYAVEKLGGEASHLHLPEGSSAETVKEALEPLWAAHHYFGPLGIRHRDHQRVAEACAGHVEYIYEELPYRVLWPEYLPHPMPAPLFELPSSAIKQAAIACYQSQLGGDAGEALWAGERYHAVKAFA